MNQFLKKSVVALALVGLCGAASAAQLVTQLSGGDNTVDVGTFSDQTFWHVIHSGIVGKSVDTLSFSLDQTSSFGLHKLAIAYNSQYLGNWSDITNYSISMNDVVLGSGFGVGQHDFFGTELQLNAGIHTLKVESFGQGAFGGSYQLQVVTSPVPEPQAWAFLLGGIGLIGTLTRRRSIK